MRPPNQIQDAVESEEQRFLRRALAKVDKAERFQRLKTIVVTVIAFAAAFAFAFRGPGPELKVECTVLIGVGLIAAVCTSRIKLLINANTRAILNAILELNTK